MADYRRVFVKGGIFFFTVVTYHRAPIFKNEPEIILLKECIKKIMHNYPFRINAIVVLPDHIHSIWTLPENDLNFSTRWRLIKKRFSMCYSQVCIPRISESMLRKQERGIWQRRFWEHLIRDNEDFAKHCDYIHYNPVKHGLVISPDIWKYSSYHHLVKKGYYPLNWGVDQPVTVLNMDVE